MIRKIAAFLAGACFLYAALFLAIETTAFNKTFYARFYEEIQLDQQLDTSLEDINQAMGLMLDYLQDERADLEGKITVKGQLREVYNERETAHMKDVRSLYLAARTGAIAAALVMAGIIVWLVLSLKARGWMLIAQGFRDSALCALLLFSFLGLWAATDFTDFWIHFHELFFTNDLWLLNPATDFMIQICPESMFYKLVFVILIRFLVTVVPVEVFAVLYSTGKVWHKRV